jgi:beta-barrel assembly-enhancing protease
MKHWIALVAIVLLGVGAITIAERHKVDVPAAPSALLYLIADTEQELTRMPVRFTRMSDEDEIRVGDRIAEAYKTEQTEQPSAETREVEAYVSQVGARLARGAHRKLPYKFHYIPSQYFINAFALPGGHVYIGGGLIASMDSEDELAAVLGHEIEHIDHYHCAERAQQEEALRKIPLADIFAIPIEVFEAGYSKDQELEADREGTRLAVESGYSANGAIRMFETFQRLYAEYQTRARTPQQELTQVALETLEGYFSSHPVPRERIAQIQKLIADHNWPVTSERDLQVGYIFWTAKASEFLAAKKYTQAEKWANRSLRVRPDQARALEILARAQFAEADFAAAAVSFRQLADLDHSKTEFAYDYALSLAASDRQHSAEQFRTWLDSLKGDKPRELQASLAGLMVLAGQTGVAKTLAAEAQKAELANNTDWAPAALGELGWWFYLAGDYSTARYLLDSASQLRPGNPRLQIERAWAAIENHSLGDALQELDSSTANASDNARPEPFMARAVAHWLAREPDEALRDYETAVTAQPEWENARWVKPLYSPLVFQTLQELQAERERRRKAQLAKSQ